LCLILYQQVFTKIMSCLIILSKYQGLCLFWGSVQMHSGRPAVNIDFQPLGLKSDRKEGRILGTKNLNIKGGGGRGLEPNRMIEKVHGYLHFFCSNVQAYTYRICNAF
jgi:hypothetical protein